MIKHKAFLKSCALLFCGFILMSADMHLQTSADPSTQFLRLNLDEETLNIHLEDPGVTIKKTPQGHLKELSFHRLNSQFRIWFHPQDDKNDREHPSLIKRFHNYDDQWLLNGAVRSLNPQGEVLTETSWQEGVLHGKQRIFHENGQLIEEREYDSGFPVNSWKTYYWNGNIATEITFPASAQEWLSTYSQADDEEEDVLYGRVFFNSVPTKEIWYNENGNKQKEQPFRMYFDGQRPVIEMAGSAEYFDDYGNVVTECDLSKTRSRSGTVTQILHTNGVQYKTETTWIGGKPFKDWSTTTILD